jgi:diacylglycerol kinase family enzyme
VSPTESLERLRESFEMATADAADRKQVLIIVNPYASTVSDRLKHLVVYALQGRYDVEAVETDGQGHAIELCREAARKGYDAVIAFGGDGTVNEAANGLAGSNTPLTCLPGGATNVYCKILGIPGDIVDATEHLLRMADDWSPRPADLGRVNDRMFAFSSGIGLDASVTKRIEAHPHLKARFGAYYFTWCALMSFWTQYVVRPPRLEVSVNGDTIDGATAIVQNADPYTYFNDVPLHVAEGATLDSGSMAGVVLRSTRLTIMPTVMFRLFSRRARIVRHRQITGFSEAREVRVRSTDDRPVPLQLDGEYVGDVTEAVFTVVPGALRVVA